MMLVSKLSLVSIVLFAVVTFAQEDSSDGPPVPPTAAGMPEQREDTKQFNQEINDAAKVIDREKGKAITPAAPSKKGKSAPKAKATQAIKINKKSVKKIKGKSKKKSSQEGAAE